MLPMYQPRLTTLGVYGSAQGMAIADHTPALCGIPREYVISITYVNVVCTAVIVQMLFL
jgi:hypothetical protein